MPLYQSHIDSLENLQYVAGVVEAFNQDRFLAALMGKRNISTEQLTRMKLQLADITNRLQEEYINLAEFGKTFNDRFTTDNNECFSSAMTLLKQVRSGMSSMINIYRKFAPQSAATVRAAKLTSTELDLYARSAMAGAEYTLPLFDATEFAPEVLELYETMKAFMAIMGQCLQLCEDILAEEEQIRQDPDACLERYNLFKEKHRRRIKDMLNSINLASRDFLAENNPAIRLRNESKDVKEFAQNGFHVVSLSSATALASKEIVEEAQRGEFSVEELMLFEDRSRIHAIRYIISHFDEFLPGTFNRKVIPGAYIACLMAWCDIPLQRNRAFVEYFAVTYKQAEGQHKPPSNPAVNQAKRSDWSSISEYNQLMSQWNNVKIA